MLAAHFGIRPISPETLTVLDGRLALARGLAIMARAKSLTDEAMAVVYPDTLEGSRPHLLTIADGDSWEEWGEVPRLDLTDGFHVLAVIDGFPSGPRTEAQQNMVLPGDWNAVLVNAFARALKAAVAEIVPTFQVASMYVVTSLADFADQSTPLRMP